MLLGKNSVSIMLELLIKDLRQKIPKYLDQSYHHPRSDNIRYTRDGLRSTMPGRSQTRDAASRRGNWHHSSSSIFYQLYWIPGYPHTLRVHLDS